MDATKFAFLGAAAAAWVRSLSEPPWVVHLNDWHAAFYLLPRTFGANGDELRKIRAVYSIHNLAYQGQRPLDGDPSSLEAWFPGLGADYRLIGDPAADDCINPMAFAIRMADCVNTVSPTYAEEICRPSDPARGFFGGEGLEDELARVAAGSRLYGILNGCEYPPSRPPQPGWQRIIALLRDQVDNWLDKSPGHAVHQLAAERIRQAPKRRPLHVMTSVGRLVKQKASLMLEPVPEGPTALDAILNAIGKHGVLILIGSGESKLEAGI
jgi:starch synthase